MKVVVKLVSLFSILIILFGFYQLNYEQDIFAQSKAYCCNNSMCKYEAPGIGELCTSKSSMELFPNQKPSCVTYILTCRDCVDYNAAGEVCGNPKNSCVDQNGNCYGWCYVGGTWQWVVSK